MSDDNKNTTTAPAQESSTPELPEDIDEGDSLDDTIADPEADIADVKPEEPDAELAVPLVMQFKSSGPEYDMDLLNRAAQVRADLVPPRDGIKQFIDLLDKDGRRTKLKQVREDFDADLLNMPLLKEARNDKDEDANTALVLKSINQILKSLPDL